MATENVLHVAVAVIKNDRGQYFITKRPDDSHQGGLWEFPGGKIEKNETVLEALKRELFEEIGINLIKATPLIQIHHDYGDKNVFLDVFNIDEFSDNAFGKEGQEIRWIKKSDFSLFEFPIANIPIINSIQLPDKYLITGKFNDEDDLLSRIRLNIKNGIQLIQFRAKSLEESLYFKYAKNIYSICDKDNVKLLLNTSAHNYKKYSAEKFSHGVHLNSKELEFYLPDEFDENLLISTSTHTQDEIFLAENKRVTFIVVSPVNETLSHPDTVPIGWNNFRKLSRKATMPVYALGGMKVELLGKAKTHGAQGIAAIGEFWDVN